MAHIVEVGPRLIPEAQFLASSTSAIDIQDNPSSLAASPIELQRLDLGKLSRDALLASDTALLCSDWMMKPQLRVLYTFLVR